MSWISTNLGYLTVGIAAINVALLVWRRNRLRGTTMMAPWYWTVSALLAVGSTELAICTTGQGGAAWAEPLRFGAAVLSICPVVALLGAKRPQDGAWQFIVFSLWVVLILPALEALVFDRQMDVHDLRAWFLLILILVGLVNTLPTRFGISAILAAAGQVCLLSEYLPLGRFSLGAGGVLTAVTLFFVAISLACIGLLPSRKANRPIDRTWLDFRDTYGVLWGMRMAERINASSHENQWKVTLGWQGFQFTSESVGEDESRREVAESLEKYVRSLMRRFVSKEWIARRMRADKD